MDKELETHQIRLAIEQMAVKDATLTLFAYIFMWAKQQGWWTQEQAVQTVQAAHDYPTPWPSPPVSEEVINIYNEEWRSFFAGIQRRIADDPTKPLGPKDPRDLWRVIPGGKPE